MTITPAVGAEPGLPEERRSRQPTPPASDGRTAKRLGAYYTDRAVAEFLVRWAVASGRDLVVDPSFGDGVFLRAAAECLARLGGDPGRQVMGVEIDPDAHLAVVNALAAAVGAPRLLCRDFFAVAPGDLPPADAVVGNPPFVRYHHFSGLARELALRRAGEAGVVLSRLTSSWAPFLVHATRFLKPGGRLAMVLPAELLHAAYAKPVLAHIIQSFHHVRIVCFARRLFPDLSEDTLLLLAEGFGESPEGAGLLSLGGVADLEACRSPRGDLGAGIALDVGSLDRGQRRVLHYHLPAAARNAYDRWRLAPEVRSLADLADVGIGYVTGDNDYFHVGRAAVATYALPADVLRPAVRHGSELHGLRYTREEWQRQHDTGSANLLLHIPPDRSLTEPLRGYLAQGVEWGIPHRYKCRVRRPWYAVPHVHIADAFVTYMAGARMKLVVNDAQAVAPNTLLCLRLRSTLLGPALDPLLLAVAWHTSLSALSCELEGHSLGGGMLKLEPSEAGRVAVAVPSLDAPTLARIAGILDGHLRAGRFDAATRYADVAILGERLGVPEADIRQLREGCDLLRSRRLQR